MVCLYFSYMLEATEWGGGEQIHYVFFFVCFFNIKTLKAFNL